MSTAKHTSKITTGFRDKNGKEIFFGDILKAHFPSNFVIEQYSYELLNVLRKNLYSVEVVEIQNG